MLPLLTTSTTLLLALGDAHATGLATCDSGPKESWQPQAKLEQMLKDKGWTVRRVKDLCRAGAPPLPRSPRCCAAPSRATWATTRWAAG